MNNVREAGRLVVILSALLSPLPLQPGMTSSKMAPEEGGREQRREAFHRRRSEYFNSNLGAAAGGMDGWPDQKRTFNPTDLGLPHMKPIRGASI